MDFNKIKCIIWDLDNTLWKGVLSEGEITLRSKAYDLVCNATTVGVINSICSNNEPMPTNKKLMELKLYDYFVFPSIAFASKGYRVKSIIKKLNLRDENVLFLDDEIFNLKEVQFYNPNIMVSQPFIIEELNRYYLDKISTGETCERLTYYKHIEKKDEVKQLFCSNEEFLHHCKINLKIENNVEQYLDRIYELAHRTNQLNFTKRRSGLEEIRQDITNADEKGVVFVKDRFGDYGLVGYYCIKQGELTHFVFSCRILNMGIEQYVYNYLNRPRIHIIGQVASSLDRIEIPWINQDNETIDLTNVRTGLKVVLKGSCDFKRMQLFLPENIKYEVQYVKDRKTIIYQNGLAAMAMSVTYPIKDIRNFAGKTPCYSDLYYESSIFNEEHDIVFLSTISLANLGVYKKKDNNFFLAMGLPNEPMYMEEAKYSKNGKYDLGFDVTHENFEFLREHYDYINDVYIDEYFEDHIRVVVKNIKAKNIFIILGNEERYRENKSEAGQLFIKANKIIQRVAEELQCKVINISEFVDSDDDIVNHFNHFTSKVYYRLATCINENIKKIEEQ